MHDHRSDSVIPRGPAKGLGRVVRPPSPAVLDRSALIDRLMGDEALAHEIVEAFIDLHDASHRLEVSAGAAELDAMESLLRSLENEYGELIEVVRGTRSSGNREA